MKILTAFLFLIIIGTSCNKYHCPKTVYCGVGYDFALAGFNTNDIDTVILRAYKADSSFGTLIASAFITDTIYTEDEFDTFRVWGRANDYGKDTLFTGSALLRGDRTFMVDSAYTAYDWEIYIPRVNRTYRIHGITISGSLQGRFDNCKAYNTNDPPTPVCAQHMSSYYLDGVKYPFVHQDGKLDYIFLTK